MGEVWAAEQHKPIHRRVALKLIKAGMDTKQVIARFESERQALAMMDHPAIAKVFEAGETEEGHPYFVMEYVQGIPITAYCDQNRLTTRAPELFRTFARVSTPTRSDHPPRPQTSNIGRYSGRPPCRSSTSGWPRRRPRA
jgi:non-specific serine/threonine protein kinase/serine/threonine-protein kinase